MMRKIKKKKRIDFQELRKEFVEWKDNLKEKNNLNSRNNSIYVVNCCFSPQSICFPLIFINFCRSNDNITGKSS
jgi:hypothetical protein